MPCSRHRSGTGVPASGCLSMARIWWSLKRDLRMWNLLLLHYENIPLLSNTNFRGDYRLALGDRVITAPSGDKTYVVQSVASRSGHLSYRVWFGEAKSKKQEIGRASCREREKISTRTGREKE